MFTRPVFHRFPGPFVWTSFRSRRFPLFLVCAAVTITFVAPDFLRADAGLPIPAGSRTLALTRGFPAETNGWEQLVYAPVLKRSIMFSQYHQRNSEPNESMVAYNFETNSWEVIDMGATSIPRPFQSE